MVVRSRYNFDRDSFSSSLALVCKDQSLAVQSQRDDADINVIVKRFGITGVMPQNLRVPEYGDFSYVVDYKSAMNAVIAAQDSFNAMPAAVRARFRNDPQEFMEFVHNPDNMDEMRKMGLAVPKVVAENPVVAPSASAPSSTSAPLASK